MSALATILSILLAVAFIAAGGAKITKQSAMMESADHLGLSHTQYQGIGGLEVAGALGLLIGIGVHWLGVLAATCLALLMIGAVLFHLRAKDPAKLYAAAGALAVLSALTALLR